MDLAYDVLEFVLKRPVRIVSFKRLQIADPPAMIAHMVGVAQRPVQHAPSHPLAELDGLVAVDLAPRIIFQSNRRAYSSTAPQTPLPVFGVGWPLSAPVRQY